MSSKTFILPSAAATTLRQRITTDGAEWIELVPWTHVLTLTTRRQHSINALMNEFIDRFVRRLENRSLRRVDYLAVFERGSRSGMPHVHALTVHSDPMSVGEIRLSWKLGFSQAARFKARGGAGRYIAAKLADPDTELLLRCRQLQDRAQSPDMTH